MSFVSLGSHRAMIVYKGHLEIVIEMTSCVHDTLCEGDDKSEQLKENRASFAEC